MFVCPKCNTVAHTRTSTLLSDQVRRSYHQCQNLTCGSTFTTLDTFERYLNDAAPARDVPLEILPVRQEHQLALLV
ncbi:MAG: ogr/Delta-like zinc finger family protein [Aeromonas sp.]